MIARRTANAGGDGAHLEAARVKLLKAGARGGREALQHGRNRHRRQRRRRPRDLPACGMHFRVNRRAEPRDRHEPGQIAQLASRDQRQEDGRSGRQRGCRRPAEKEQQVPPEQKCLFEIVGHSRGSRCTLDWIRRAWHREITRL